MRSLRGCAAVASVCVLAGCQDAYQPEASFRMVQQSGRVYFTEPQLAPYEIGLEPSQFSPYEQASTLARYLDIPSEPYSAWTEAGKRYYVRVGVFWGWMHRVSGTINLEATGPNEQVVRDGNSKTFLSLRVGDVIDPDGHTGNGLMDGAVVVGANCGWEVTWTAKATGVAEFRGSIIRDGTRKDTIFTTDPYRDELPGHGTQPSCEEINPKGECDDASTEHVEQCSTNGVEPTGGGEERGEAGASSEPLPSAFDNGYYCAEWTDWYLSTDGGQSWKYKGRECHRWESYSMSMRMPMVPDPARPKVGHRGIDR
jgi:hypothetical protein